MAKTYRNYYTKSNRNNKHQAEAKSKAKRRDARRARRQYDWHPEFEEEQWLLEKQNKSRMGGGDPDQVLTHWEPQKHLVESQEAYEETSWDRYQEMAQWGCTHIRMCVAYTSNGRPCGYWVGIDREAKIYIRGAFGPNATEESMRRAFSATLKALLRDSGQLNRVMNHKFKTNGKLFAYWSCSGKLDLTIPRSEHYARWAGDLLIEEALETVSSGAACPLMLRGYTVAEIVANIRDIVESSREIHSLRALTPSPVKQRKDWFARLRNDTEFCRISYEDIRNEYAWYAKFFDRTPRWVTQQLHHHLQWSPIDVPTAEDISSWRDVSGACLAGTQDWLSIHKEVPSLRTLMEFTKLFGAGVTLRRFGVKDTNEWYPRICKFLEQSVCSANK